MKQTAAVIGLGFVGKAHLDSLRRIGVSVRGMLGSSRERSEMLSESLGLERAYVSLDELAEDHDVSVVHICTPTHTHVEQASRILPAGQHVLGESRLALGAAVAGPRIEFARTR